MRVFLQYLILTFLCVVHLHAVYAQCTIIPISINERITKAKYILIGEITEQHCYKDKDGNIYTLNKASVHAWAKNHQAQPFIYVITYGGVLGDKAQIITPSLQLKLHEKYLLLLADDNKTFDDKDIRSSSPAIMQALAYAGTQGALLYQDNKYFDVPYNLKIDEQQILQTISSLTSEKAITSDGVAYTGEKIVGVTARLLTPTISNLSPNPTNAGTIEPKDFLTITGSGFGNVPGKVEFKNADNGGSTYITVPTKTDYVSWSDNSITVKVPAQAGTGTIRVNGKTSTEVLNINYSLEDVNSDFYLFTDTVRQRYYLRNLFGSIGYIFNYNTTSGFSANSSAKEAFERALTTWRCKTGINWQANGTTSEGNVADNVNVVMFYDSLDAGTLAVTTYNLAAQGNSDCFQEKTVWYLQDVNMQFATVPLNGYTWQFGPALPNSKQYDFETVAVHELGHAHGLAHLIAPGEVMNYSIPNGTTIRVPSNIEFEGAQVKMDYSTVPTCFDPDNGGTPMTKASCVLPIHILAFKAELQDQSVLLSWQTTSEYNTANFIVQRSIDGVHFTDKGTVNAAGNSSTINRYQLLDNITGLAAGTIYYRLKETDKDGKSTLSGISMVTIAGKLFMIYPNPAKTYVRVVGQSIAFIELLDATGKPVYKKNVSNENAATLNISAFSKGIYTLLIKDSKGNTENRKLIIE